MFEVYAEAIEFFHENQYTKEGLKIDNLAPLDGMDVVKWHQ